jgi:hypothetical protein
VAVMAAVAVMVVASGCGGGGSEPSVRPGNRASPRSPAHGARAPSGHERAELVAATRAFIRSNPDCCKARRIAFLCARISTISSRWAVLMMSEVESGRKYPLAVTLHHGGFSSSGLYATSWHVTAFGSGDLDVPPRVRSSLEKAVLPCAAH